MVLKKQTNIEVKGYAGRFTWKYEKLMNEYITSGVLLLDANEQALRAVSVLLGHKNFSIKLMWYYVDERLKLKFAVQYGGDNYYEIYLKMGAINISAGDELGALDYEVLL